MWWIFSTLWLLFGLFVSAETSPYTEEMAVRRGRHRTREDSIRFAIGAAMVWPLALLLVVLEWRIARRSER